MLGSCQKYLWLLLYFLFGPMAYYQNDETKLLLITGCGRSGTEYMATLLRQSGYDINHERPGEVGCVSWPMAVGSFSPWGPLAEEKFQYVFHQVRNPLDVITSWRLNLSDIARDEWKFIRTHVPEISEDDTLLIHCAKYWYYWNLKVEKRTEWRYRIEDVNQIIGEFESRCGLSFDINVIENLPRNTNTWAPTENKTTWKELELMLPHDLYINIQEMALRYGYEIDDVYKETGEER